MKRRNLGPVLMMLLLLALAACGGEASQSPVKGDRIDAETFEDAAGWETGIFAREDAGDAVNTPESTLAVQDGRYRITYYAGPAASFIWGAADANRPTARDVIIEVETEQLSADENNLYGVMCRLSETASGMRGYAFLISGDGYYAIAELTGRDLEFLLEWRQSGALNEGQASNALQAVCVGDYLALYANGEFLGQVTDAAFGAEGHAALIAGAEADHMIDVAFDNLVVYAGTLADE